MKNRSNNPTPFVSVIIPTYHDWDKLNLCIEALKHQTYQNDCYEVIIINNDPEDEPPNLKLPSPWKLIAESKPGSYAARNTGVRSSRGEILAFTDSDCIPHPDWIDKAVEILQSDSNIKRVAGRIELFYKSEKLTPSEIYEKSFAFPQKMYASSGHAATANMIAYKSVFDKVGFFNESMMSGGDTEWGLRAQKMAFKIVYGKDCIVKHPARNKISDLIKKGRRITGANLFFEKNSGKRIYCHIYDLLLPVTVALDVAKKNNLSIYEKFIAILVFYFLKINLFWYKLNIIYGFIEMPRE